MPKITVLPPAAGANLTDLLAKVNDPSGAPATQKVTLQQVVSLIQSQGHTISVYASGSTADLEGAYAVLNFGTTDPVLTIDVAGTYLLLARVVIRESGLASDFLANFKLRRTNNTAGDVANSETTFNNGLPSALGSETVDTFVPLPYVVYTTINTTDSIALFAVVNTPAPGALFATEACILAIKLF